MENNKLLNCKVRCVYSASDGFVAGNIYNIIDGKIKGEHGGLVGSTFESVNALNSHMLSQFDLYEEPQASPIKDSGNRREFETGAVRDMQEGKGRCDLLPAVAILRLARHFENGCKKYGDRNWEKGIPIHSFIDSAIRHLLKYLDGQKDEDHLTAAAWNCICAMWTEEKHPELQDIPSRSVTDNNVVTKSADVTDTNVGENKMHWWNCFYRNVVSSKEPC